jgi:hypothetical protein
MRKLVSTSLRAVALVSLALLSAACATRISSDVARFHNLPPAKGETVRVVPLDPAKQGSLEFASYANLVGERLGALGYRPAASGQAADLEVRLDYAVSPGREKIESRPATYASLGYGWGSPWGHRYGPRYGYAGWRGWYDPWGSPWFQDELVAVTVYTRSLSLDISRPGGERLFEGKVESVGRDNRLPEVMPYLVQSLFSGFPGTSGKTERVVIEVAAKR